MSVQPARLGSQPRRRLALGRALSLEHKLPLLMTAVLVAILAASLFLTYRTLTRSAEAAAAERLARAARQVASTVEAAMRARLALLHQVGREPAVRRALVRAERVPESSPLTAAELMDAQRSLARLVGPDSSLPAELWDARGRRLISLGGESALDDRWEAAHRLSAPLPELVEGAPVGPPGARRGIGPMYGVGSAVFFWAVAPVEIDGRHLGYVAQLRRVGGPREATQSLRALIGEQVELQTRNEDGAFWASAPGQPGLAPLRRDSGGRGIFHVRQRTGRTIAAEAAVAGTPWVLVLETPVRSVHARPRATLLKLASLSVVLTLVGAGLSWVISRRLTRPLASLTTAAEAVARGEYAGRVGAEGDDEIGRLSASFDQMASEVAASRRELEGRVAEAQSAALALERANRELQRAMRETEQSKAEAERANRAKSDFLAVMSHELRTPLNAIAGYRQLLDLEIYGPITGEQRDALARIARSQAHLLGLINDVLNFAKIDAGHMEYEVEHISVGETLMGLEPLVAPQVQAKRLSFRFRSCDPGLSVYADREKLKQIVLNLLTNAIKFTPEGGSVVVDCDARGDALRIQVRDTGVGIPAERLPWIFDPFVQVDRALNRPNEGVGLGLAISRDLARGMGGDILAESILGVGSVFTLTIPFRPAGAADTTVRAARTETV